MKIFVYEPLWIRGGVARNPERGALTTKSGLHCCIGFATLQCGIEPKLLVEQGMPSSLYFSFRHLTNGYITADTHTVDDTHTVELLKKLAEGGLLQADNATGNVLNSQFVVAAAPINDDSKIDDEERKELLSALAAEYGHEFVFIP